MATKRSEKSKPAPKDNRKGFDRWTTDGAGIKLTSKPKPQKKG